MKKTAVALLMALIVIAAAGTTIVGLASANPYHYEEEPKEISPPSNAVPPAVSISSPKNNSVFASGNITMAFGVDIVVPTLPELWFYSLNLEAIYYKASWLPNNTYLDLQAVRASIPFRPRIYSNESLAIYKTNWLISGYQIKPQFAINLTSIPEGSHSVEVFATMLGSRETSESPSFGGTTLVRYGNYHLIGSASIRFSVEYPAVLSPENKTYDVSSVQLNFTLNNSYSKVAFSVDGQPKATISENTTLFGLSNGSHNVTVYANDNFGNMGASETISFTVAVPASFPTVPVAAGSAVSIAAVTAAGLILTRRRHREEATQK